MSDAGVAFLVALHAAGVAFGHVNDLAARLTPLAVYVNDGTSRGDLVALLAVDTPADIATMLGATPGAQLTRSALVRATRPHAQSAADLTTVLTLCTAFRWAQLDISTCLTPTPNGSALAVLEGAVHAAHLVRFVKATQFSAWMDAVGDLVTEGYVTIAAVGDAWIRLNGNPVTDERNYRVNLAAPPRTNVGTFCVHFHPNAAAATVGNTGASPSHFKPERGGDVRRLYEAAPASIRARTQRRS